MNYSETELIICVAARLMEDRKTAFIGTGIPMLAAALAQKLYAPNLVCVFEFGGTGARLEKLPLGVGDSRTFYKGIAASGICDIMETAQRGFIEYGFLGGAQIDMYGNLNTTVIGEYERPKVRLPGSGGANDVGSHCWKTIIIMRQHDKKRFVRKLDFMTTPGYLDGKDGREKAGLPPNTGPYRVISNLGLFGFDEETKRMKVISCHPGVSIEKIIENTDFELIIPEKIEITKEPTEQELKILREEVDKDRLYI